MSECAIAIVERPTTHRVAHLLLPRLASALGRMVVFIFSIGEPIIERKPICIEEPSALPFRLITISGVPGTPTFLEGAEGTEKGFLALRYQVLH